MSSESVFHYSLPTNGWRTVAVVIISLSLLILCVFLLVQHPHNFGLYLVTAITLCFALFSCTCAIVGFRHPDATEMRIDRRAVYWRTPWPRRRERMIQLDSILRITAWTGGEQDRLAFRLLDETIEKVPSLCFGNNAERVLGAIKEVAPQIDVHRRTDSFLDRRGAA